MVIVLGADHGGFMLKEHIKKYLKANDIPHRDFGTHSEASTDYPDYALKVAQVVADDPDSIGILCCGTGIGMSIAANKVKGIRAALCNDLFCAEMSRKHNDANILCLGARVIDTKLGLDIVETFLNTEFEGGRHSKRLNIIREFEKRSNKHDK
jgi:ribose 5-phosphate isomerase B